MNVGLVDMLLNWFAEWEARKFGKGCARAMLFSANVMRYKYEGLAPTYAWLARKALTTRSNWHQIDETNFVFEGSGQTIEVTDGLSVIDVVHLVIEVELTHSLSGLQPWRAQQLKTMAHEAADSYVRR